MKTGVVMVVHGGYGAPLLEAAQQLVGPIDLTLVEARFGEPPGELRGRIAQAVAGADQGQGVLLITDLCGSTPANICQAQGQVHGGSELVGGLNLAMLIKLSTCDRGRPAHALAEELRGTGVRSIQLGSDLPQRES